MRIFIKNIRRDGKLTVVYVFPDSGAHLTKIITREKLECEQLKGYEILRGRQFYGQIPNLKLN